MRQIGDRSCRAIAKANPIKHHARTVDQRLIIEGRPKKPEGFTKPCLLSKDGVLQHREIHQHIADLEGTANATRDPLRHSKAVHNLATELNNTRIGRFRSVDLAHGERRLLELALALAAEPALLLLDEPMAGAGSEETKHMIEIIAGLKSRAGILLIEHDMDAVFQLADRVTVIVEGGVIASGPPDAISADSAVREAYLGSEEHA